MWKFWLQLFWGKTVNILFIYIYIDHFTSNLFQIWMQKHKLIPTLFFPYILNFQQLGKSYTEVMCIIPCKPI